MIVREWQKQDVEEIVLIENQCFSDPWSKEMFLDAFSLPICLGFVVENEGHIVGYACQTVLFEDAEILNIAVKKEHRREGLGKKLMLAMQEKAVALGAQKSFLEVRVSNESALRLYRSLGYNDLSVRKKYYEDGEDALVMQKLF
ncbi:MAG: ribosomal protein S18-alanine N-acetyltransferase [Clostridia bacterium]|nr:ribosomal protein S18-alanine N-acetyltransferase [Clostridia bacterium]